MTESTMRPPENKFLLPPLVYKSIADARYDKKRIEGKIVKSATELLRPPQQSQLMRRNVSKITWDASEGFWSLMGQLGHSVMESHAPDSAIVEKRLYVDMGNDFVMSVRSDCLLPVELAYWDSSWDKDLYYEFDEESGEYRLNMPEVWTTPIQWLTGEMCVTDHKFTSTYAYVLSDKPDWEWQLNMYYYAYARAGVKLSPIMFNYLYFRDWTSYKAMQQADYPDCAFHSMEWQAKPMDEIADFIRNQFKMHQSQNEVQPDDLIECTSEEQWEKPTSYACMKKGAKMAKKVFKEANGGRDAAVLWEQEQKTRYEIIERIGEKTRCERFCKAKPFCRQFVREGGKSDSTGEELGFESQ